MQETQTPPQVQPTSASTPVQPPVISPNPPAQSQFVTAKKNNIVPFVLLGVLLLVAVGVVGYILGKGNFSQNPGDQQPTPIVSVEPVEPTGAMTACTMEAKICPDGSAVGRSGPNCEFAECPSTSASSSSTTSNSSMCGLGYILSDTETFTMCVPDTFPLESYRKTDLGVIASYKNAEFVTLSVYEEFIGGWGPDPCIKQETVQFRGKPANQITVRQNLSNSGPDDKNPQCGETLEILVLSTSEKWAVGLNGGGKVVSIEDFNKAKDTFQLK